MNARQRNRRRWMMTQGRILPVAAIAALGSGCEFNSEGTGHGPAPQLCQVDLEPHAPLIDDAPDSGIVEGDGLYEYEAFVVRWYISYDAASDDWDGDTGAFRAEVEIVRDDELYWFGEKDCEPLGKHHGRYDEILVPEGLPAGAYTVRVTVDPDGAVYECNGTKFLENNTRTIDIDVLYIPIDDVTTPPPDDDEPAGAFDHSDSAPHPAPSGAGGSEKPDSDPDPNRAPDDRNEDPSDPGDPPPPDPIRPVLTASPSAN